MSVRAGARVLLQMASSSTFAVEWDSSLGERRPFFVHTWFARPVSCRGVRLANLVHAKNSAVPNGHHKGMCGRGPDLHFGLDLLVHAQQCNAVSSHARVLGGQEALRSHLC